jgi:hypothetical protein
MKSLNLSTDLPMELIISVNIFLVKVFSYERYVQVHLHELTYSAQVESLLTCIREYPVRI